MIFGISTDSCTGDYEADSADEAARQFALDERIPRIRGVTDLEAYLERVGGYGHVSVDGVDLMRVAS